MYYNIYILTLLVHLFTTVSSFLNGFHSVLYYTRHEGTLHDFLYFYNRHVPAEARNITRIDPNAFSGFGLNVHRGWEIIKKFPFLKELFFSYEIIIVSDTIPDAIPFLLLKQLYPDSKCNIILQVTNRFDFHVRALNPYYELIRSITIIPRIFWIINNPYELEYMKERRVYINATIVRPFGESQITALKPTRSINSCVYNERKQLDKIWTKKGTRRIKENLESLPLQYGGPKTLSLYKCFVFIPYQVSVMKMAENMAAGVITLIPSAHFLEELARDFKKQIPDIFNAIESHRNGTWEMFIEFYHPRYREFFYHFKSWNDLQRLVNLEKYQLDHRNVAAASRAFSLLDREVQFNNMKAFFRKEQIHLF